MQLRRIREGSQIEEDHMRNRQLIVHWLLANTDATQIASREGKTFYRHGGRDDAFREGVGRLLAEVQRIKAEGDYEAARELLETYGVHFDPELRDEVVARVERARPAVVHRVRHAEAEPVARRSTATIVDVTISLPAGSRRRRCWTIRKRDSSPTG